jgi:hypothetical protein
LLCQLARCRSLAFIGEIDTVARKQKVTGSQDDEFVGVFEKIPNKLALMGLRPTQGNEKHLGLASTL